MTSATEAAYLAGIIDGEGHVGAHCQRAGTGGRRSDSWVAFVSVSNTDRRLLDWLADRFGGAVTPVKPGTLLSKPSWLWKREGRSAEPLLRAALPYLVLKREQADAALAILDTAENVGRRGHPPEVVELRRSLASRLRDLNRRGVAA